MSKGGDEFDDEEEGLEEMNKSPYDLIDFERPDYEVVYSALLNMYRLFIDEDEEERKIREYETWKEENKNEESEVDPIGEIIECVVFNTTDFMCYDYDKIMRADKARHNFNLEKQEREKIVGTKEEWEKAIASHFFYESE